MRSFLQRVGALLILLLSLTWLCRAPDWEPLIACLVALFGYLGLDFWHTVKGRISSHDKQLAEQFLTLVPPDSSTISFLRSHDIAVPFPYSVVEPLFRLHDTWKGIAYEFEDKKLERAKGVFFDKLKEYVPIVAWETWPHDRNSQMNTMDFHDWDNPPEKVAVRDRMNKLGSEVLAEYENYVRLLRKNLNSAQSGPRE